LRAGAIALSPGLLVALLGIGIGVGIRA
jgi:hypothetical protein